MAAEKPPRQGGTLPHGAWVLLLWLYVSLMAIAVIGSQSWLGLVLMALGALAVGLLAVKPYLDPPGH